MLKRIELTVKGLTQHVQHNGQLADQSNPYVIRMKLITSKPAKQKTAQDFKNLDDLEWEGSLYLDAEQRVIVPGTTIEGALYEAGKTQRMGPSVRNGVVSDGEWPLLHDGPKALEKLKENPAYRFRVGVKNPSTGARVMRTRPVFKNWSLTFQVLYDPEIIGRDDVIKLVQILGSKIGLSDDRKKMGGRFQVVSVRDVGDGDDKGRKSDGFTKDRIVAVG